ncbi:modular serine protease-like isoform X2 [Adelges cooleyi]|uniref:modular serine protease-like isoform X2 n=1 Tax=Adelges cooleyi TaxID=133065 RepID=UPI00217FE1C5|nr:modular serine protease-like isoform X2 [Adelges cooleyi]
MLSRNECRVQETTTFLEDMRPVNVATVSTRCVQYLNIQFTNTMRPYGHPILPSLFCIYAVLTGSILSAQNTPDRRLSCSMLVFEDLHYVNFSTSFSCPSYAFRCKYGACIDRNFKCDGKRDCIDGSDENLPECKGHVTTGSGSNCPSDHFKCKSGECIDSTSTCDGTKECKDGSDETHDLCKQNKCPSFLFKCKYGACVTKDSKCNGVKNCADGSDEDQCHTVTTVVTPIHKPSQTRPPTHPSTHPPSYPPSNKPTPAPLPPIKNKKCTVPNAEGSVYTYSNNNQTLLSPGTKVNQYDFILENCKANYYQAGPARVRGCMDNEVWTPVFTDILCLKMCSPMMSDSLNLLCTFNGDITSCSKPSQPGTKLKPSCKPTHSLPNAQDETPIELTCQQDGQWSGQLYKCVPDCGRLFINSMPLISNGNLTRYGEAPWNTGVYRANTNNSFDLICGASLISPNLAVSAAHCFWQDGQTEKIIENKGLYKVAVGKFTRGIDIKDNEFTQIVDVERIHIESKYYGSSGFHAEDIAVIVLPIKVTISIAVSPVCVDWKVRYSEQNGATGLIVGWGKTENAVLSSKLLQAKLPYIDHMTCRNMYTNGFELFVTSDKFCAGSKIGQGVHEGDSGAGLTFVHSNLYYLAGVVSVKDPNTNDSIAVFTDVGQHVSWLRNIYLNYSNDNISRTIKLLH